MEDNKKYLDLNRTKNRKKGRSKIDNDYSKSGIKDYPNMDNKAASLGISFISSCCAAFKYGFAHFE